MLPRAAAWPQGVSFSLKMFVQGDRCHCSNGQRARWGENVGFSGNQAPSHHLHVQAAQRAAGSRAHWLSNRPERPQVHHGQQHFQVPYDTWESEIVICSSTSPSDILRVHIPAFFSPKMENGNGIPAAKKQCVEQNLELSYAARAKLSSILSFIFVQLLFCFLNILLTACFRWKYLPWK